MTTTPAVPTKAQHYSIDHTHLQATNCWVDSAAGHPDFPLQNLPLGVLDIDGAPHLATAIGEHFVDLRMAIDEKLLGDLPATTCEALRQPDLNAWMGLRPAERTGLRHALFALLRADGDFAQLPAKRRHAVVRPRSLGRLSLPARVGDYTDFYAGIHHATNAGKFFRPNMPLLPNYKHVPIGYHGRSSSLGPSGEAVQRPAGQILATAGGVPTFEPSRKLDFELELAIWIAGGNRRGQPVALDDADDAIAGYGLLNDWSARDIQAWEYQPLGPFLGKNFLTTVSGWVVTGDALAPFRAPAMSRMSSDPQPLPYLRGSCGQGTSSLGLDIALEATLSTLRMRREGLAPLRITQTNAAFLWWTPAQLVAHHTSGGCNLRPGDLFGSGTISGPNSDSLGSLLEMSEGGLHPLNMPSGEIRLFLEAGDEIVISGRCQRPGFSDIGFGKCSGHVLD